MCIVFASLNARLQSSMIVSFFIALFVLIPCDVSAGKGRLEVENGVGVLHLYLRPKEVISSQNEFPTLENKVEKASRILWDATEGQVRIGSLTVLPHGRRRTRIFADIFFQDLAADSGVPGRTIGVRGEAGEETMQISLNEEFEDFDAGVLAHELVHYVLGCGDGYYAPNLNPQNACMDSTSAANSTKRWGMGDCIDSEAPDNTTLMQTRHDVDAGETKGSELCVAQNHDPVKSCGSSQCTGCKDYQRTDQDSLTNGESCWETAASNWNFLQAPNGMPDPETPSGFIAPEVFDFQGGGRYSALVLDRSGSMGWASHEDYGEVCNNGSDDDGDGSVDETDDCSVARMTFLKAGARAWLRLAEKKSDWEAAIISFSNQADVEAGFQSVQGNVSNLQSVVDGITPTKSTAIGDALMKTHDVFESKGLAMDAEKFALLFSDGKHNYGSATPEEGAQALWEDGIHVNSVATGQASQRETLKKIQQITRGHRALMAEVPQEIVAQFALQFAFAIDAEIYIPRMKFHLLQGGGFESYEANPMGWFGEYNQSTDEYLSGSERMTTTVRIAAETNALTIVSAGTLDRMSEYGVEAHITGPDQEFDTESPQSPMELYRDPYYDIIRIPNPTAGEWSIELRTRNGAGEEQYGTLRVFGDSPVMHGYHRLSPRILPSTSDSATLLAHSNYSTRLRDLSSFSVAVEGPRGNIYTFNTNEEDGGVLKSILDSLPYRGGYRLQIAFETDSNTTNHPGEYSTVDPPASVPIPSTSYGRIGGLFVENGEDPELNFRQEEF